MKKKYGNLTIRKLQQICENHDGCIDCPIYQMCPRRFNSPDEWKKDLDTEVKL